LTRLLRGNSIKGIEFLDADITASGVAAASASTARIDQVYYYLAEDGVAYRKFLSARFIPVDSGSNTEPVGPIWQVEFPKWEVVADRICFTTDRRGSKRRFCSALQLDSKNNIRGFATGESTERQQGAIRFTGRVIRGDPEGVTRFYGVTCAYTAYLSDAISPGCCKAAHKKFGSLVESCKVPSAILQKYAQENFSRLPEVFAGVLQDSFSDRAMCEGGASSVACDRADAQESAERLGSLLPSDTDQKPSTKAGVVESAAAQEAAWFGAAMGAANLRESQATDRTNDQGNALPSTDPEYANSITIGHSLHEFELRVQRLGLLSSNQAFYSQQIQQSPEEVKFNGIVISNILGKAVVTGIEERSIGLQYGGTSRVLLYVSTNLKVGDILISCLRASSRTVPEYATVQSFRYCAGSENIDEVTTFSVNRAGKVLSGTVVLRGFRFLT
jgi:hypothetical protein